MTSLESEVEGAILSAAASFLILWIAFRKGAFTSLKNIPQPDAPPSLFLVLIAFAIYIGVNLFFPLFLGHIIKGVASNDRILAATWITFLSEALTLICLFLFLLSIYRPIARTIWRRNPGSSLKKDLFVAILACIISFPIILFVGQFFELAVYFIFHTLELPDQTVVLFLKMTFGNPLYFLLATLSIIIFAPLIEELLFRGFFQTFLGRYFNRSVAILFTSVFFAFFHYSKDQGLGNIPIIGSLFVLSNILGYIYEKQGSLITPITLHAAFNTLSIINLYFSEP